MKTKELYLIKRILQILICLLVFTPFSSAEEYLPYLHNPTVPEHPDLDVYGSYKTDLFPGAATYSFDIEVPPGTHGLAPPLSIFYNSQLTNLPPGLMGTGWSFTQNYVLRNANSTFSD